MFEEDSDKALLKYVVVASVSLLAATLFYFLGGSLANVSNNSENFLGFSFQASGAIAGFIIIYALSTRTLTKWDVPRTVNLALKCRGSPRKFSKKETYEATYCVTTRAGKERTGSATPRWDGTFLVVDLRGVNLDDKVSAEFTDSAGNKWVVSGFYLHEPVRDADIRPVTVSKWARSTGLSPSEGDFAVQPRGHVASNPSTRDLQSAVFEASASTASPPHRIKLNETGAGIEMNPPSGSRSNRGDEKRR